MGIFRELKLKDQIFISFEAIQHPALVDFGGSLDINEPQLQLIDSTLSIDQGRLASYNILTRVKDGKLQLHPASFDLNTEGHRVLIRESCQNYPGRIVKSAESLKLTTPKLLLLPSDYDVQKIGKLVNHPSFITVEGEESYTLVLVPEKLIHNKGELSHGKFWS